MSEREKKGGRDGWVEKGESEKVRNYEKHGFAQYYITFISSPVCHLCYLATFLIDCTSLLLPPTLPLAATEQTGNGDET